MENREGNMEKRRVMIVGGTRPEFIKLVSTIKALEQEEDIELFVVHTGQHVDMVDDILDEFNIDIDYRLRAFGRDLTGMSAYLTKELTIVIKRVNPDLVIVQGDTLSAFLGAYTAFLAQVKILHLEAGARSGDLHDPYPEEGMRLMIDSISDYLGIQCVEHASNLSNNDDDIEKPHRIIGNTSLDALKLLKLTKTKEKKILLTMHRRENWKNIDKFINIVKTLANLYYDWKFVFVVHPNPLLCNKVINGLGTTKNVQIRTHMRYKAFLEELATSYMVISDSGGVSQEAPSVGTPVIMTRNVCENTELIKNKLAVLLGVNEKNIIEEVEHLITDKIYYSSRKGNNPYGDGNAHIKIIELINEVL